VEDDLQRRPLDMQVAVVLNKTHVAKLVPEETDSGAVVATNLAGVSWLIFAIGGSGLPSLPKLASGRTASSYWSLVTRRNSP